MCVLAAAPLVSAQTALPDFGDVSSVTLSPAEERRLGEAFMREVRARLTLVDDPGVEEYVESVGHRLAAASEVPGQPFHFFVVAEDDINAFAGPGGYIGINAGLITSTDSEGELASVIAHEMAHVTQRHIARRFEQQERSSIPVFAGIVAAIVLGTQSPDLGQAAAAATLGSAVQTTLNFSREAEQEADRVGLQSLVRAGYDPRAMPSFLVKLQSAQRYARKAPEYLSTHPLTTSRIADLQARAGQSLTQGREDSLRYLLVKAKLEVLSRDDPQSALELFEDALEHGEHENVSAAAYGLGLALARTGAHDKASKVFEALVERHPEELSFRIAAAENEFAAGRVSKSMALYEEAHERHPSSRALVLAFAEALVQSRRSDEALALIDAFMRSSETDHRLHRLAAEAYAQRGETTRSRFSLAEHYYLERAARCRHLPTAARGTGPGRGLLPAIPGGGEARGTPGRNGGCARGGELDQAPRRAISQHSVHRHPPLGDSRPPQPFATPKVRLLESANDWDRFHRSRPESGRCSTMGVTSHAVPQKKASSAAGKLTAVDVALLHLQVAVARQKAQNRVAGNALQDVVARARSNRLAVSNHEEALAGSLRDLATGVEQQMRCRSRRHVTGPRRDVHSDSSHCT